MALIPFDCIVSLVWLLGSCICLILVLHWKSANRPLIAFLFGLLTSFVVFLLFGKENPTSMVTIISVVLLGLFAFGSSLFWFNVIQFDRGDAAANGNAPDRELLAHITVQVRRNFTAKAIFVFVALFASLFTTRLLGMEGNIVSNLFDLLLACLGGAYLVLGEAFYRQKPWAYTPVKYLSRFEWLEKLHADQQIYKRIQETEVRRAFGHYQENGSESH